MEGANSSFVFETFTKEKIEKLITNLNIRYTGKYIPILIKYFLKINAVFVKALILNIFF